MLSAIGSAFNLTPTSRRDGLKEDIEKLDRKLRWIQATVEEVENREIHDEAVKLWLQELKCLAGDAEDVLDECHYEILRCQLEVKPAGRAVLSGQVTHSISNSAIINYVSSYLSDSVSLEMGEKISQINSRFDEIARDREALRLTNEDGMRRVGIPSINLSSTSHLLSKDGIFGRSHDKEEIINLLCSGVLEDDEIKYQLKVIPILGMGGIGKTTVAQMVYNDPFVKSRFDVKAWVYVSSEFDIIRLTKEITECVTGKHGNSFDGFSKNQEVLLNELVGKRMLLVLDDVWDVTQDDWETFFLPLRAAQVVRVLATSRNEAVTEASDTVSPYRLYLLPQRDCLKLFYHYAFGGEGMREGECSLDNGKEIIKRCGRLPLAIKCIARALRYNKNQYVWRDILYSELWEFDEFDPIFRSLKISYYHLHPKLRDCFLFCSLFPKGSRLRKISIIYMWIAHGFVLPKGRKSAEDIGEEYLAELQLRFFIEPCTKGSFRLHDVIYDLARSLSGGEIHTIMDEKSSEIPEKIRHLYIKKGNNSFQSFRPERLRTLFNAPLSTHGSFIDLYMIYGQCVSLD
ncbi:Disease resistance protein RGA2 [Rhynchospora pubera]|uniref:Disease resistance protein RGA2 n=1 Tax=Rhynchospora pubera TaxID=906938 RepID=A0AAV8D1S2_9POAL|nr:Disease resistance protein RGA2 [Rhynchospora pubera]